MFLGKHIVMNTDLSLVKCVCAGQLFQGTFFQVPNSKNLIREVGKNVPGSHKYASCGSLSVSCYFTLCYDILLGLYRPLYTLPNVLLNP